MADKAEKEAKNMVHQNAILVETIKKEISTQKLYTNYSVNPYNKMYVVSGKVNSPYETAENQEGDLHFVEVIKRSNLEPTKKFAVPQTESQEIGWITRPLIELDRSDKRLHFPKTSSEVTKYMDAYWKSVEQGKMNEPKDGK